MSSIDYNRVREIFEAALPCDDAARRDLLDEQCGDDAAMRAEVESLLEMAQPDINDSHLLSDQQIERVREQLERAYASGGANGNGSGATTPASKSSMPEMIGRYRIIRRVASGGMGTVYEAQQSSPRRRVAIKMVHAQRATKAMIERLNRESEILGRLQHPGIAQVYEAGTVDLGEGVQPYFSMEYVDGLPVTKYADVYKLDDRARLALLAHVCDAVHYAHGKGIIHRDLKPDNILVDSRGTPKVLDFGVARVASESTLDGATMTREGQILGTLSYMAPEQMDHGPDGITSTADVYALGVIGFELLASQLPHDVTDMSIAVALRELMDRDPPTLETIDTRFRGDVQIIIGKALERDPARRYESAAVMAADIRRYLAHEPIHARPPSRTYRAGKFVRRNRALVGGTVATMLVLVVGTVVALVLANQERVQRQRADESALSARAGEARIVATVMETASRALEAGNIWDAYDQHQAVPEHSRGWGWRLMSLALPNIRRAFATPAEGEGHLTTLPTWRFFDDEHMIAFDPDTSCVHIRPVDDDTPDQTLFCDLNLQGIGDVTTTGLAVGWSDQEILIIDLAAEFIRDRWTIDGEVSEGSVSDDGRIVSARIGQHASHVWVDGKPAFQCDRTDALHPGIPHCVVSCDGQSVFVHETDHVRIIDLRTDGSETIVRPRAPFDRIVVQPITGGWLSHEWMTADQHRSRLQKNEGTALREPAAREVRLTNRSAILRAPRDGAYVAVGGHRGVHIVNVETANPAIISRWQDADGFIDGGNNYATFPVVSPSGDRLAILTYVRPPWLVDLSGDQAADPRCSVYRGHTQLLFHVAISSHETMIASLPPIGRELHIWDADTLETIARIECDELDFVSQDALMAFTPDDRFLIFTSPMEGRSEVAVVRYEIASGETELFWSENPVTSANHAPLLDLFIEHAQPAPRQRLSQKVQMLDDEAIAIWRDYRTDFHWPEEDSARSEQRWKTLPQPGREPKHDVLALSVHPIEDQVATVGPFTLAPGAPSPDGVLTIRDALTGERQTKVDLPHFPRCVAYSPDGSLLAIGTDNGRVLILETEFYTTTLDFKAHQRFIYSLAWMNDRHRLVTVSGDATVRIWDDRRQGQ